MLRLEPLDSNGIAISNGPPPATNPNRLRYPAVEPEEFRRIVSESGLFDPDFYRRLNPDIARLAAPLEHYLQIGGFEWRRAHPRFDAQWYAGRYGDVLTSGLHPLVHYILIGRQEGRSAVPPARLFDIAKKMISEARAIEHEMLQDSVLSEPDYLPLSKSGVGGQMLRVWQAIFDALPGSFDYLVFAPWLVRGGADVVVVNIIRAAAQAYGPDSTLLVLSDSAAADALDWLPKGTRVLCFSHASATLSRAARAQLVTSLIYAIRPKAVMNVNSTACWDAIASRGKALSQITRLFACLFFRDYTADGGSKGYVDTHFRNTFDYLTKVYSDNETFVAELIDRHGIPSDWQSKLTALHQPPLAQSEAGGTWRPPQARSVLWAGRYGRQKNVELLVNIAKHAPDLHFDVYGYGDEISTNLLEAASRDCENLRLRGRYRSFTSLPVNDYDVYLYTSLWDGLPNTLIEAGSIGIPVVASAVGGIAELVTDHTGWLVTRTMDSTAYIDALREACDHPDEAHARADRLTALVRTRHTMQRLLASLNESPSFFE
ncbi:glycosyltransferase (plasmid) [Ralstonia solanacearum]|nr:glycosyltransferase [Ralstonia solanacearum]AXW78278.1 glycosyltransferase [Ralstonia solanacearum]